MLEVSNQTVKRSRASVALIGLACALAVSACGGDSKGLPRSDLEIEPVAKAVPVAGPVLHGDRVAWGTGGAGGGEPIEPIKVFVATPRGSARVVYEEPENANRSEEIGDFAFAGSSHLIAFWSEWCVSRPSDDGYCRSTGAYAAVVAQSGRVHMLEPAGGSCVRYALDADGPRVAFAESCSGPSPGGLGIDDVTDSKPPRILIRSRELFEQVRLAGNYVAGSTRREIFIYDLKADRKITYRPPLPPPFFWAHRMNDVPFQFDIQADGTAVAVWGYDEETKTAWFSPEEPEAHALPFRPYFDFNSFEIGIRLAEDRIAFERKLGDAKSELVVAHLSGKIHKVASFDRTHLRVGGFDFDGKRLTWASQEVLRFAKQCSGPPEAPGRHCWPRPVGPTTIYMAWLA